MRPAALRFSCALGGISLGKQNFTCYLRTKCGCLIAAKLLRLLPSDGSFFKTCVLALRGRYSAIVGWTVGFRTICHRRQLLWFVFWGMSQPCLTRISVASLAAFRFRVELGPYIKISTARMVGLGHRCSQSSNFCAGSFCGGLVFSSTGVDRPLSNLSNRVATAIILSVRRKYRK